MAIPNSSVLGGHTVDLQEVINSLSDDLGSGSGSADALCDAICRGDEDIVRLESSSRRGPSTLAPKRLAIECGRSDFLAVLLEQDSLIDDELIRVACQAKSRPCIRTLLDFGWPINKNVGYHASLLWSVATPYVNSALALTIVQSRC